MPANEQTWRDLKLMHVIFGVSGLIMLGSTIWMLDADHRREWKKYQRQFRNIETWTADVRIQEEKSSAYSQKDAELKKVLAVQQSKAPPKSLVEEFKRRMSEHEKSADVSEVDACFDALSAAKDDAARTAARQDLIDAMQSVIRHAQLEEGTAALDMRFAKADLEVVRSRYEAAVGNGLPAAELARLQAEVDGVKDQVATETAKTEDAKTHRLELERILAAINADEAKAQKALDDHEGELNRLNVALDERTATWGERLLEMPIIDGFGRQLKVDQIWLPKLTIDYNFRDVARFDRCTTCHQGIDKTAPGSSILPAYEHEEIVTAQLETPAETPPAEADDKRQAPEQVVERLYGMRFAEHGLERNDVTIAVVWPETAAARAGLETGDTVEQIRDVRILDRRTAFTYLVDSVPWGEPLELTIRRGVPHPYSTHPRLDLFVGSLSPHTMMQFGCTICHDGQGSATQFQWASHTPNTPGQQYEWERDHGWFRNHHWIFPMFPKRFAESSCLKCHFQVTELDASTRFPEPPAPKVVKGYNLVRQFGCFGCHEINGFNGPDQRVGPDLRAEPNYFAAALQVLADPGTVDEERELARRVVADPENHADRRRLAEMISADVAVNDDGGNGVAERSPLSAVTHNMATVLGADNLTPGTLRKVGPSLRFVASKLALPFLYNWVRKPTDFRPTTRMPEFFGQHEHLKLETSEAAQRSLGEARRYEPVEIQGIASYLLSISQPYEYRDRPANVTLEPSAERGKRLFQLRGCLACHQHKDFPEGKATHGPELSRIGGKLASENGQRWLYSWLREPTTYHARTLMPNTFLEPIEEADGGVSDPAADIAAFLMADSEPWQPPVVPVPDEVAVDELALLHLKAVFTARQAQTYLKEGIPESLRGELKGDEALLVGDGMTLEKKLHYVGRRALSKYGCSGCHDIPSFEDTKPIGTTLADWGRKDPSKLAFEQIIQYLTKTGVGEQKGDSVHAHDASDAAHHALDPLEMDPDTGFFVSALLHHQREGFIWQKLRAPRSFDYEKTQNKTYNEWLRMPRFRLAPDEIEAIITFVLGLVADPPESLYVYAPTEERRAIVEGKQVIDKYNCAGCHTLEMETWEFEYNPDEFEDPVATEDFAFLRPHFTAAELEASRRRDRRGLSMATVHGMPAVDESGRPVVSEDDEGNSEYFFDLWKAAAINGQPWYVGSQQVPIPASSIISRREAVGGDLARMLYPVVVAQEKQINPNVDAKTAWGWLPPPLLNEGQKVQTGWLHDFLLQPYAIRPSVVLRMPRFNMSPAEARKLVDYFAAVDGVPHPFEFDPRTRENYLAEQNAQHPNRLDDALKLVINREFCVKCHKVGDYTPAGSVTALAPQLDEVYRRMRPDFLLRWLGNPKTLLPYTGMPANFPYGKETAQDIFRGTSEQQLEAIVDLLLNYDTFTKDKTTIEPQGTAPPAEQAGGQ